MSGVVRRLDDANPAIGYPRGQAPAILPALYCLLPARHYPQ